MRLLEDRLVHDVLDRHLVPSRQPAQAAGDTLRRRLETGARAVYPETLELGLDQLFETGLREERGCAVLVGNAVAEADRLV